MRLRLLAPALLLFATGCASTSSPPSASGSSRDPMMRPEIVERDVIVDGVSILGVWHAVGALDEPDVDEDLRRGILTETLVVNPRGRAVLSGEDDRADTDRQRFEGQIDGNRLAFDGLPGVATLSVRSDGRILMTDPRGRRTVYERE